MATATKVWPDGPLTLTTSAAVTGNTCLAISGDETVATAGAATNKFIGIAAFDAASGASVTVLTEGVYDLPSSGTIAAGVPVECGAAGVVVAHTEGTNDDRVIGKSIKAAASNICRVNLAG
jgi:predicted RecA/RadA family phage recombinase